MQHIIKLAAIIAFALTCFSAHAAPASKDSPPRFADYPVAKLSNERVKRPIIPKHWDEDPKLRLLDTVGSSSRANFAGRYFMAITPCGSACVGGAIFEARTGKMISLGIISSWVETHDDFEGIAFRHDSRMFVMSGQRNEKPGDMGRHYYVFENGRVKFLKTLKTDGNFMTPLE